MEKESKWTGWHTFGLLVIVIAIVFFGLFLPVELLFWAWIATLILIGLFIAVAGQGIIGLWRGLFIDEMNRISLSRFQLTLWTIIVLSSFFIAALYNIATKQPDPLSIKIPEELWVLIGISTTSLVGSPLIKGPKKDKEASKKETDRAQETMKKLDIDSNKITRVGLLIKNITPDMSRWSDLFSTEEMGNIGHLDLAKVQMFFFTIILVLAYCVLMGKIFVNINPVGLTKISEFPSLDPGMVALLGISHAGYLTNKGISHTST